MCIRDRPERLVHLAKEPVQQAHGLAPGECAVVEVPREEHRVDVVAAHHVEGLSEGVGLVLNQ